MGSIRLILAFAVMATHVGSRDFDWDMLPGHVAVQAFFVISGFYMSLILKETYATHSVKVFYTNRLLRLFPTYFLVLILSFFALFVFDVGIFTNVRKLTQAAAQDPLTAFAVAWGNLVVLGQELGFLLGVHQESYALYWITLEKNAAHFLAFRYALIPQAWSLSMELYFYLLAPFLLKRNVGSVGILFLSSLVLRLGIMSQGGEYDAFVRRFFPCELWLFLAGALSHFLYGRIRDLLPQKELCGAGAWLVLVMVLALYPQIDERYALYVLVFVLSIAIPLLFNWTRHSKWDRFLGNLSFPFYMVHFLIIAFLDTYMEESPIGLTLSMTTVAALGLYFSIEAPIDRWRKKRLTSEKRSSTHNIVKQGLSVAEQLVRQPATTQEKAMNYPV